MLGMLLIGALVALSAAGCGPDTDLGAHYQLWVENHASDVRLIVAGFDPGGDSDFPAYLVPPDGQPWTSDEIRVDGTVASILVYDEHCTLLSALIAEPAAGYTLYDLNISASSRMDLQPVRTILSPSTPPQRAAFSNAECPGGAPLATSVK